MRISVFIIFVQLIVNHSIGQNAYMLYDVHSASDLNYNALNSFNASPSAMLDSVFNPLPGKFKVYRFIEANWGYAKDADSVSIFRNILIIKTDQSDKIVDAYQYTLDWAEPPLSCDLFRLNKGRRKKLVQGFCMSNLRFKMVGVNCEADPYLTVSQQLYW